MPMAGDLIEGDPQQEKKRLAEEKKKLKTEQKDQKKEAKRRAKELSLQEAELLEDEESSGVSVFFVTTFIVVVWIAILCLLVKLDVGGFGSGVLTPILKNVPVVNKILPTAKAVDTETGDAQVDLGEYGSIQEAVAYIKELEIELQKAQSAGAVSSEEVANLQAEIERLKTFETNQVEFQRIKNEFYGEVIYAENGPGAEEYQKYYESMDPATAEYWYKQVVQQLEESKEITDYAATYSAMKPKEAAAIFEAMTDNLSLAARILSVMSAEDRGAIMGAMKADVSAKLTKIMDPES